MVKTEISPEDMERAEGYAALNCQTGTICTLMGWQRGWVDDRPDILRRLRLKRAEHKLNLRTGQCEVANGTGKSRATMLIFLGKNDLGQSDVIKNEHELGTRTVADIFAIVAAQRMSLPVPVKQIESEVIDAV